MGCRGSNPPPRSPPPTLTLATAINCIGIGFQRGTHTRWQLVANDSTGAPTLTDMGASFPIATGGVLTLYIAAPPNGSSVWVRVVDGVSGAVFEQEITADLPANTQFLSPRLFMNTGATAAAVAYDCAGVYPPRGFMTNRAPTCRERYDGGVFLDNQDFAGRSRCLVLGK